MNILDAVLSRGGICRYSRRPIADDLIQNLLQKSFSAPDFQIRSCHFIIVNERQLLEILYTLSPYSNLLLQAPLTVLVCADLSPGKGKDYWIHECSSVTENMIIAAHAKGLGAVWIGVFPKENRIKSCRELLLVPGHVTPFSLVPLGYPAEETTGVQELSPERIHYNRW